MIGVKKIKKGQIETYTTADIADSVDKRYQTDNQQTYNDATSSIQTQLNTLNVNNITITTAVSITTDTNDGSGYGQHGRNVMIPNGANAINLSCEITSNANFVSSYTKLGSSNITFVAGSGATLVQMDGTAILSGVVGSTACLTRSGNTYYLQISNR